MKRLTESSLLDLPLIVSLLIPILVFPSGREGLADDWDND
jgi:hypothetical protein